jgi:hypothetical protein
MLFISDYRVWRTSSRCPRAVPYEVACWFVRRSRSSHALLCVSSACYVARVRASFARCRAVRARSHVDSRVSRAVVRVVSRVAVLLRERRHVSFAHVVAHRSWVSCGVCTR